ncbi:ABC transporter substrate-binding protein [Micromonospora sagamiensis]|uniref:Iron complex transport system substrate-binding protein n=1 Tax=Micromonospora sagamiensis TaxID=47875 RepID=A0A562WHA6_9ACTN|nr:ABC transporter substrate-binding protein [Micromonospora sagamiensis]TWJ28934.1 iron complex transport system substrate-binding protein [Micromonospora sagamiensis]BCL18040.1 ABC transporter substrate-binding protein [Micromonospora sagamiensis]
MRERALSTLSRRVAAPLTVLIVLLGGCGTGDDSTPAAPESAAAVEMTNCGTPVRVAAPPRRAVTMNQPATEIMLALGLADRMAGTAYLDDAILPEYAAPYASVPVLAEKYPAKEKLLEAEPDFVYGSFHSAFGDEGAGDRTELARLGIGTYLSPAGCPAPHRPAKLTIDHVFGEIRDVAAIFGVPDRAEKLIADQRTRIATAAGRVDGAGDLSLLWWDEGTDAPGVGACCGTPGLIMSSVGVGNAFADLTGAWADSGWETVAERDPDVIVLVDAAWDTAAAKKAFLTGHPTLRHLRAVTGQRFVVIPFSATSAGVRVVRGVEALAEGVVRLPDGTGR